MKRITRHLDTDLYILAAARLGLDVDLIDPAASFCRIHDGAHTLFVKGNLTSLTDAALRLAANDKTLTNRRLSGAGIPVPQGAVFTTAEVDAVLAFAAEHAPVVIKPNGGSLGRGITLCPQGREAMTEAVAKVRATGSRRVLVESFIAGTNYRVLVHDGEVVDVLERRPPFVVGDGVRTIQGLVAEKSEQRRRVHLKPLQVEPEVLAEAGLGLDSVPRAGRHCRVHSRPLFAVGGEGHRLRREEVAAENLDLFAHVADACALRLCGIDFISPDIAVAHGDNGAAVNEVNSCPNVYIHYHADMAADLAPIERILARHFGRDAGTG